MYTKFYRLRERPFNLTPDSHFLYFSTQHRDALGHLLYGIRERKGFMLVSGEVGTGKTTLCRTLIKEIEGEAEVGFIINSFLSAKELLRSINEDLCCHRGAHSNKELVDELNRFLLEQHERGRTVVVLIDECQNLSMPVLEQIRMLSNLETDKEKLIQIIMIGQPELREKIEQSNLRQLAQRISVTYHLQPLDYRETENYIHHRLSVAAGGDGKNASGESGRGGVRFSRASLKRIFLYSEGIPRKINILCDRALLVGYVRNKQRITDKVVRRAIAEIQKHPRAARGKSRVSLMPLLWKTAAAGACTLAGLGLLSYYLAGMRDASVTALAARRRESVHVESPAIAGSRSSAGPAAASPWKPGAVPSPEAEAALLLAKLWNREGVSPALLQGERDLHALAGRLGMKAIECWAGVDFLSRANLPCILRVAEIQGGGKTLVVLKSLREGAAGLARGDGGEFSLARPDLEARLRGRATYFYPSNLSLHGVLAPGMTGRAVSGLQAGLRSMNLLTADEDGWYGPKTAEAVGRLQERCGLPRDGVAGINENILIMSEMGKRDVPRLAPTRSGS